MPQTGAHASKKTKLGNIYHCTVGSLQTGLLRTDYPKKKRYKS